MKLVIDMVRKVDDNVRFAIWGSFLPDSNEKSLYADIVDAQKTMENPNSALIVKNEKLLLAGAPVGSLDALRVLFKRNFDVVTKVEYSDKCKFEPKDCESTIKMELK